MVYNLAPAIIQILKKWSCNSFQGNVIQRHTTDKVLLLQFGDLIGHIAFPGVALNCIAHGERRGPSSHLYPCELLYWRRAGFFFHLADALCDTLCHE